MKFHGIASLKRSFLSKSNIYSLSSLRFVNLHVEDGFQINTFLNLEKREKRIDHHMFLHHGNQYLFVSPFKEDIPHNATYFFPNATDDSETPNFEDPFIKNYFETLKQRTILLQGLTGASNNDVYEFMQSITNGAGMEFVCSCFLGTDHERSLDFLRSNRLNLGLDIKTARIEVWFIAFQEQEPFDALMKTKSKDAVFAMKDLKTSIPQFIEGMDAWTEREQSSHYATAESRRQLKKTLTEKLVAHDREEHKYLETIELIRNKPDRDGWVKVLPKIGNTIVKPPLRSDQIKVTKKRKHDEIKESYNRNIPLYTFQLRQEKEREVQRMRKEFEEARKKIQLLKSHNIFDNSLTQEVSM